MPTRQTVMAFGVTIAAIAVLLSLSILLGGRP
jgi:hypothetical protein